MNMTDTILNSVECSLVRRAVANHFTDGAPPQKTILTPEHYFQLLTMKMPDSAIIGKSALMALHAAHEVLVHNVKDVLYRQEDGTTSAEAIDCDWADTDDGEVYELELKALTIAHDWQVFNAEANCVKA